MMDNDIEKGLRDDERINAFLRGKMSGEQERQFLSDVKTDSLLRDRAIATCRMAQGMKAEGRERDRLLMEAFSSADEKTVRRIAASTVRLSEGLKKIVACDSLRVAKKRPERSVAASKIPERSVDARKKPMRRVVAALSVAATVLVLLVVGLQYRDYRLTTQLGHRYATETPYDFDGLERGATGQADQQVAKELADLFANVRTDTDLSASIKRLWQLWELSTAETYNEYTNYAPLIGWHLAVACLEDNDRGSAREVLTKLQTITEPDSYYNIRSKKLLSEIETL